MRCLVTAGPSYESLDRVRRLTNFSTGGLGTRLADALHAAGHEVVLLRGRLATAPPPRPGYEVRDFTTSADLAARFLEFSGDDPVAVFHAAAVADFGFGQVVERAPDGRTRPLSGGKLPTRGGPIWVELMPTPKLLDGLRDWYPLGWLVGWKYEVEGPSSRVVGRGIEQLKASRSDVCVLNGPGYGPGFGLLQAGTTLPEAVGSEADLIAWLLGRVPVGTALG